MRRSLTHTALALTAACLIAGAAQAASAGPADHAPLVLAQAGALDVPDTVDPGQELRIPVTGSEANARIEVWGPVTSAGRGRMIQSVPVTLGQTVVQAPWLSGSYELRYVSARGSVIARRALDVAAVPVSITVLDNPGAGGTMDLRWRGPGAPGDKLVLVHRQSGTVLEELPLAGASDGENVVQTVVPSVSGDVDIRYVRANGTILTSISITSSESAWLRAPIKARTLERVSVQWFGTPVQGHVLRLVDPGTGNVIATATPQGSATGPLIGKLRMPVLPGRLRIEYADPTGTAVKSSVPIQVDRR